ncbi:MAG: TraC family protein, partial [Limisphaerales bacterium]
MSERAPDGFFVNDLILFNSLRRGGYVAKGFVFEAPDLTNSPIAYLNEFQNQLGQLLESLNEGQRLQVQYFSDSDYKTELLRYQQETERFENVWTKRSRNERFMRYWQAMVERKLRRQRVIFYISRPLENTPKTLTSNAALREYYATLLGQLETDFEHTHYLLKEIFASAGTRVLPMSNLDHFKHYKTFLNPSLADRFDFDAAQDFSPELSIQENCWHSEGNGQSDFGFYLDGHYHSVIALTRWPRTTYPGIIQRLTNLRLLDYTITVNIDPLLVTREISKEEKEHDRIAGDYASEKKVSLLTVMQKKQRKISALMQGQTIPFNALFVVRVWDKSKDGLTAKASAIKNAINSMNSAQYFESNLPTTSKNLFFQTWPGWTFGRYEHRKLYSEHRFLADMLPVTSTFTGHLATAEAIYDGPHDNLVGIETFSGSQDNKSPQHAVLLGMSGAGKSVTVCDLLSQTEGYFGYTVIIEEGLSYGIYTATVEEGARPIIIHPDGDLTINYLDTKGLPLTPDHLSAATALVARMIGTSAQEDKQMLRQAQIAKYLNLLYEDAFQDWQKKRHDQLLNIARHALALQKFRLERMPPGATSLETFADFRDWKASHLTQATEYL